jgi:hypothetical protein
MTHNEPFKRYCATWRNYPANTLQRMYRLSENDVAKDAICTLLCEKLTDQELELWLQSRGALILEDVTT